MLLRRPGRFLAPLALVAAAVAVLWTVQMTLGDEKDAASTTQVRPSTSSASTTGTKTTPAARRRRTYVVKAGDTLLLISDKTGVTVDQLMRLNPNADPQSLRTGQRLRLRR